MLSSHLNPVDRHGLKVLDPNWSQPGKPANQILRALSTSRACGHRPRAYLRKVSSSGPLKRHSGKPTNRSGRRRRCTPCPVAAPSSSPSSSLANFMSQMLEIRELSWLAHRGPTQCRTTSPRSQRGRDFRPWAGWHLNCSEQSTLGWNMWDDRLGTLQIDTHFFFYNHDQSSQTRHWQQNAVQRRPYDWVGLQDHPGVGSQVPDGLWGGEAVPAARHHWCHPRLWRPWSASTSSNWHCAHQTISQPTTWGLRHLQLMWKRLLCVQLSQVRVLDVETETVTTEDVLVLGTDGLWDVVSSTRSQWAQKHRRGATLPKSWVIYNCNDAGEQRGGGSNCAERVAGTAQNFANISCS